MKQYPAPILAWGRIALPAKTATMDAKLPNGLTPWVKGQSGNPAGRPRGSRHLLAGAFLRALHEDFKAHGASAIVECRETDPAAYLTVLCRLVPKELKIELGENLVAILGRLNGTRALEPPTLEGEPEDVHFGSPGGNA